MTATIQDQIRAAETVLKVLRMTYPVGGTLDREALPEANAIFLANLESIYAVGMASVLSDATVEPFTQWADRVRAFIPTSDSGAAGFRDDLTEKIMIAKNLQRADTQSGGVESFQACFESVNLDQPIDVLALRVALDKITARKNAVALVNIEVAGQWDAVRLPLGKVRAFFKARGNRASYSAAIRLIDGYAVLRVDFRHELGGGHLIFRAAQAKEDIIIATATLGVGVTVAQQMVEVAQAVTEAEPVKVSPVKSKPVKAPKAKPAPRSTLKRHLTRAEAIAKNARKFGFRIAV